MNTYLYLFAGESSKRKLTYAQLNKLTDIAKKRHGLGTLRQKGQEFSYIRSKVKRTTSEDAWDDLQSPPKRYYSFFWEKSIAS